MNKKILLIDGNNLGWRAVGQAPLTYRGNRVEAIYIGINIMRGLLKRFEPDRCWIAWDGGLDINRLRLYPAYKKKRKVELTEAEKKEREAFFGQMKELQLLLHMFGMEQYQCNRCEADDIIYSLIKRDDLISGFGAPTCTLTDNHYIIVSTDRDFYQMLDMPNVEIYNPIKQVLIRADDVAKEFKIHINNYLDYKAMVGDASDNLPGVKGLGPKKASWLVRNLLAEDREDLLEGSHLKVWEDNKKLINLLYDNLDTFLLMRKMMKLAVIDNEILNGGKHMAGITLPSKLDESIMKGLLKYGFEKHLENYIQFSQPFTQLWRRSR